VLRANASGIPIIRAPYAPVHVHEREQSEDRQTLKIFAAGNESEIKSMMHGQVDALVRGFLVRNQQALQTPSAAAPTQPNDPLAQLERLGELRDRGLLSDDEFEVKKAELLGRP
jgi:hypothetical protein